MIALEPRRPFHLMLEASAIGVLCERREVVGVPTPIDLALSGLVEQLGGVLANGVEQKKAVIADGFQEACVDERRELIDVRVTDFFGGVEGEPACEDGQLCEEIASTARRAGRSSRRSSPAASSDAPVRRELRP